MDAGDVVRAVWAGMQARDWEGVRALLHEDVAIDWPQTRERIQGADAFVEVNRTYPGDWRLAVEEVVAGPGHAAIRVTIVNGAETFYATGLYQVRDGRIARGTELFAEPGEPPYDRSHLTTRVGARSPQCA